MRLIDADRLQELIKIIDKPAWMIVRDAPTIEAEPVVRCKACKHAGKHEAIFFPGHIPCGLRMQPTIVKPDDFCSYGERRADDATD